MSTKPYHLHPVSPSPTASTTPPGDRRPHYKQPRTSPLPAVLPTRQSRRRPMSPSSLRELDLSHTPDMHLRKYPVPPTGHDLMEMFPTAAPANFEMHPGFSSSIFKRQERAFFAQAGKEIVRVRVDIDLPNGLGSGSDEPNPTSRPFPELSSTAHSPGQSLPAPLLHRVYPHPATRPAPRMSVPVNPSPMFPPRALSSTSNQLPSNLHHDPTTSGLRTPPEDTTPPISKPEYTEEYEPDESWRRPTPIAERRPAGKHTRHVIRT